MFSGDADADLRQMAQLMIVTPGCHADDRALAAAVLARAAQDDEQEEPAPVPAQKRRWWQRRA
ncbi:hypothetical protein [Micromonospora sp. NPDC005806]|uniref:hypothetical protein n=1 Tax=Micromonospora sp. NPDC005806 TaxID=3364234 RepID=UPI0036BB1E9C